LAGAGEGQCREDDRPDRGAGRLDREAQPLLPRKACRIKCPRRTPVGRHVLLRYLQGDRAVSTCTVVTPSAPTPSASCTSPSSPTRRRCCTTTCCPSTAISTRCSPTTFYVGKQREGLASRSLHSGRNRRLRQTVSTGSRLRLHGTDKRGVLPPRIPSLDERPVMCSRLDDGMRDARHLGSERRHGLAAAIDVARTVGDVSAELVAEAVVALACCGLRCHSERTAQARVAVLRHLVRPRKVPDWQVARSRPQNFRNWR
jgi:hypothetical protein